MCRINKFLFTIGFFLSLFQIAHSAHRTLEEDIASGYRSFCTRRYEEPALTGHYVHSAVRYVYHLQAELDGTLDLEVAKKIRTKIFEILTYGTGVGGIDPVTEASEIEKKIMLGAFYEVCKGSTAARDGIIDSIFLSIVDPEALTSHQRVLYSVYQASKDVSFYIPNTNLVQHSALYKQLQDYILKDNPHFVQGFVAPISGEIEFIDLTSGNVDTSGSAQPNATTTLASNRQQSSRTPSQPEKVEFSTVNADVLDNLYRSVHGVSLSDKHRITEGKSFSVGLLKTPPSDWRQLVQRCADRRSTSNLAPYYIYTDICFHIAKLLGWISSGGEDSSNPGRQIRHIANEMKRVNGIELDEAQRLINSLGYGVKKVREKKGLRSWREILDF